MRRLHERNDRRWWRRRSTRLRSRDQFVRGVVLRGANPPDLEEKDLRRQIADYMAAGNRPEADAALRAFRAQYGVEARGEAPGRSGVVEDPLEAFAKRLMLRERDLTHDEAVAVGEYARTLIATRGEREKGLNWAELNQARRDERTAAARLGIIHPAARGWAGGVGGNAGLGGARDVNDIIDLAERYNDLFKEVGGGSTERRVPTTQPVILQIKNETHANAIYMGPRGPRSISDPGIMHPEWE